MIKKYIFVIIYIFIFLYTPYSIYSEEDIKGNFNTLISFKEDNKKDTEDVLFSRLIQYYDISFDKENYSLNISGWGKNLLSEEKEEKQFEDNEISSAYFQYYFDKYPIDLKIGRFFLNEGIARQEQIDGLFTALNFKKNIKLHLYHGLPLDLKDEEFRQKDKVSGGRLSKKWGKNAELGISYLEEYDSSILFRKEGSFDLYYLFQKDTQFVGLLDYNFDSERISHQNYFINYFPNPYFVFTEEYKKDYYKYIFPASTSSIFSNLENETAEKWKTIFDINYSGDHSLLIDYQTFKFHQKRNIKYYGGEVRNRMLTTNTFGISFHRMDAGRQLTKYNETREFFRLDDNKTLFSFEAIQIFYNKSIYNRRQAYQFMITGGYYFNKNILATGTLDYQINSIYKYNLESIFKLNYNF